MTARWRTPSTSRNTASTRAVRPARNMSCASARRWPGRSRTRLPLAIRTPPTVTDSSSGVVRAGTSR
ncbi:hypothetical protein [Microbispora sp. CSR-4]|uniref:hypothetical protein n=1 Tax=Microbispora sp. CSR-4 TaxID=2592813 RepID=UPI001C9C1A79|nr:hypothetical protein [Microbispora sp. CSR-4]